MSSTLFTRWSAFALMLGGLLSAVVSLFHPFSSDMSAMLGPRWLIVHNLAGVALLLTVPGLAGLYAYLGAKSGTLGLVGFMLASMATTLMAGLLLFIESVYLPIAASNPAFAPLADPASDLYRDTLVIPLFLGTCLIFAVGFVLLGVAIVRDGELPRFAGYLVIVGGFLFALPVPPLPIIVSIFGVLLFGSGLLSVGYAMWRSTSRPRVGATVTLGASS